MTLFVDASVLVAIISKEPDRDHFLRVMTSDPYRLTSPIALWETARALSNRGHHDVSAGIDETERFCAALGIDIIAIGPNEAREAAGAQDRYGKGRHPARLNMGDCFAYACAKTQNAKLLYKGNDFAHTDFA